MSFRLPRTETTPASALSPEALAKAEASRLSHARRRPLSRTTPGPACLFVLLAGLALHGQTPAPPSSQQPVFRTGIEILTVDATVVDREGRQITDLTATEFEVEVDGDPRPVVSAEYVKLVDDTPIPVGAKRPEPAKPNPDDAFYSTNARTLTPGRTIVILVDQGNIRVGQGRLMMRSAVKFVDGLTPSDRVAMVAIPQGALVDFTTNHERVREALLATVGLASPFKGRYHISLSEAIATVEHSDQTLRQQLFLRECGGALMTAVDVARCEIEVEQEAAEIVNQQRIQTQASLRGMREVLKSLAAVEGPKSVILISEGLVLEGLGSDVDDIAAIAADVRASLDVMLLDVPPVDVADSQRPTTPREDRDRQVQGLESLAGLSRGALHRVIVTGDNAFQRVMRSISGHYLIGVESRPRDRDGRRHRIHVKSLRRGTTIYSRRGFLAPTAPGATTAADAVDKALRAPLTLNDIPLRLATWTYKEPGGSRVRLLITAEIERGEDQALDYTAGLVVVDRNNKAVASNVEKRTLVKSAADAGRAVFAGSVMIDPGSYLLRMAFADSEGRIGSIERKVDAWQMNTGRLSVGDLLIAQAPNDPSTPIQPSIEPQVSNGRLAAVMEIYAPTPESAQGLQATLEIVPSENARALTSAPMEVSPGKSAEVGVLLSTVSTGVLPPGRYFAKATVTQGGKPQGHITRPFRVLPAAAGDASMAAVPSALPSELLGSMLATLPGIDRKELLAPPVLNAVFGAAEQSRPAAKAALASARGGKIGPAALDALAAGDQVIAAFLRGVDLYSQGQNDRAILQLQIAMQGAPNFAPARLYLGAALAQSNRHREAASLLQSVAPDVAGAALVARLTGLSWLRAGDANLAIAALEKSPPAAGDAAAARTLALAYVAANRPGDAMPLLTKYLDTNPADQEALLAAVYASYATHAPTARPATIGADRTRAQTWAKAYAAKKGQHQALVDAWVSYLQGAK
jgi:VWFA-related protein